MNEDILREAFHEMFSSLEALETQNAAILSFLKEKGIATDDALAPHFEQAANASNVRWRAAKVRIDYLLSSATKAAEQAAEKSKQSTKSATPSDSEADAAEKAQTGDESEKPTQSARENPTKEKAPTTEQPSEDKASSAGKKDAA